jgi:pimeloyl-ACP methyl ester carboxylesterase
MWAEHLDPLAQAGYRAVAMDLSGFGEAAVAAGEQAPWIDVLATMDAAEIHEAVIVGNSFGGAVALRAAVLAPQRVSALALISAPAPGVDPSPELEAACAVEESALERGDLDGAVAAVIDTWTLSDAPATLREQIARMQRRAYERRSDAEEISAAEDPIENDPESLRRLEVPTLIAVGEHDKREFRRGAELLATTLPNARLEVIEGAGHLAPLETPETFRALLLDFLTT